MANTDPEKLGPHLQQQGQAAELVKEESEEQSRHSSEPSQEDEKAQPQDGGPIAKKTSKASVNNYAAIPNGGLQAWLQVAGGFMLFFNNWGVLNTFGVYQTYYESSQSFQASSSDLSWIGALQACLLLLVGALTGPIYDLGYFRTLIGVGSFLVVFGQMMLSLCTEYYQVILAQAVCIGIGAGCLFVPSVAIISTYFNNTRIALAMGIAASGSSLGGVIYPIVFYRLQPTIGFAWATRVIGFIMLATLLFPNLVMKVRVLPAKRRALLDLSAFKELPYVLTVMGLFVGFMGLYIPFFYLSFYSITSGITDQSLGFYILPILNSGSIFGRIIPNLIADYSGPINMIIPCSLATSVLIFGLIGAHSEASVIVIALLYGFFSGTFVSLPPSIYVHLSPNRGVVGTRMGMGFSIIAIGVLVGTPIAGAILGPIDQTKLNFTPVWAFGGALTGAGCILLACARCAKVGWKLNKKA